MFSYSSGMWCLCVNRVVFDGDSYDLGIIGINQGGAEKRVKRLIDSKRNTRTFSFPPFFVDVFLLIGYVVFVS